MNFPGGSTAIRVLGSVGLVAAAGIGLAACSRDDKKDPNEAGPTGPARGPKGPLEFGQAADPKSIPALAATYLGAYDANDDGVVQVRNGAAELRRSDGDRSWDASNLFRLADALGDSDGAANLGEVIGAIGTVDMDNGGPRVHGEVDIQVDLSSGRGFLDGRDEMRAFSDQLAEKPA